MFEQTANGGQAEFLVVLAEQADLSGAAALSGKSEKTRFVRDALWEKAQATQGPALHWLREQNIEHRSYYVVNLIWAKAGIEAAQALAARPEVARVEGNPEFRHSLPQPTLEVPAIGPTPDSNESPAGIEQGISYTRAPEVWSLGYTGQGIVVGGADTGVRWDHNALKNKYRGWNGTTADHNYNWHDSIHSDSGSCGQDSPQPCDANGHGSHTMGTMVGDDGAGNQIGMAPGAKWIGCRALDAAGSGTNAEILECLEFFLAPYPVGGTPEQGDPEKAPDVALYGFGGAVGDIFRPAIAAQRAAGIMPVSIAGNTGGCQSMANLAPGGYDETYTVGALNNGTDSIANFSSRGPVFSGGQSIVKPDLTAPGTNVRSSYNNSMTGYQSLTSTSMAAAHVAGGVALVWSAEPGLRGDINDTERFLNHAAFDIPSSQCGPGSNSVSPNNTFGHGRLNVRAAVATGLVVTTTADHNDGACSLTDCTLREAINAANAQLGDDIIKFAPGLVGTIQLTSVLPNLSSNILVQGPGANVLAVRRNTGGDYRIFTVGNGTSNGPSVDISGLTIANGQAPAGVFPAGSGGGILNDHGTLTLTRCAFDGNRADFGGGIMNLRVSAGTSILTLSESTFVGNTAPGHAGGALYNFANNSGSDVRASLTNCTLSGNSSGVGGALYNNGSSSAEASVTLTNCTVSGNSGESSITNSSFVGTAVITLRNSIFKTGATGPNFVNDGATYTSQGNNLSNDSAGGPAGTGPGGFLNNPGDIRNTEPQIASLANNGGPTQTHALMASSPAINAGNDANAPLQDQRGYFRLGTSDIGAFEFDGIPQGVEVVSAVSRKAHGAPSFDINLPLTGPAGVECRTGGAGNDYQVVLTFAAAVTFNSASITSGTGSVSSASGSGTTTVTVNLTGVTNAQRITVTLVGLSNGSGTGDLGVQMGVLIGDTDGNGSVNSTDIGQVKAKSGQGVTGANFRFDVTADGGSINASDISLVKSKSGTQLPP